MYLPPALSMTLIVLKFCNSAFKVVPDVEPLKTYLAALFSRGHEAI